MILVNGYPGRVYRPCRTRPEQVEHSTSAADVVMLIECLLSTIEIKKLYLSFENWFQNWALEIVERVSRIPGPIDFLVIDNNDWNTMSYWVSMWFKYGYTP